MNEMVILGALALAVWLYKGFKRSAYPLRLNELERALDTHAQLFLHRNKDEGTARQLLDMAETLKKAQYLLNDSSLSVKAQWPRMRPTILHLTSEEVLRRVDIFYSDRREPTKQAVYSLVEALDKKERQGVASSKGDTR